MRTQIPSLCLNCKAVPVVDSHHIYCPECTAKHEAQWKEEHTRKPGDTRKEWLIGDECRFTYRNIEYQARIVDMSDVSRRDSGNYDVVQLELTKTVRGFGNELISQTWIHPEPVQSYKLKKPLLK